MTNTSAVTDQSEDNKSYKLFSLKQQISRILLSIIIIIMLLLATLLAAMIRYYQSEQNKRRLNDLAVYAETMDNDIIQLNNIVGTIYSINNAFQGMYSYKSAAEKCDHIYTLMNLLQIQVKSNQNLSGIFVYYDNLEKALYYVNANMPFLDKEAMKNNGRIVAEGITHTYERSIVETENEVYYSVLMKKSSAAISGSIRLSLGLPDEQDRTAAYGIIYEGTFYRISGENIELTYDDCANMKPGINKIKGAVVYLHKLGTTDISVVEILPQTLWLYISEIHIMIALLSLLFAFFSIRLYRFVSDHLSKPLEDMTDALQQIQAGVWEVKFTAPNRIVEIENVRQTVSVMLKEIERYKIRSYEEQLDKQKTQLQYLQLQLAPHFYTNCLKNAYYMLILKEYENVEHFLLCLSTYLRYLLQKDVTLVSVRTERDFVLNYISLQKQITAKPITCEIAVDEDALEQEIPILTLQTFVENSVKYTFDIEETDLVIQIHIKYRRTEDRNYLDITISDNGHGYPEEVLHVLNRRDPSEVQNLGVGVINLQSRMRIHYGKDASWYFDNTTGAFSELVLPAK